MAQQRYILCRPHGGLNDMLCQIEACRCYGADHDRLVIVDTGYAHIHVFYHCLSNYFESRDPRLVLGTAGISGLLESTSVHPLALSGRLGTYEVIWDNGLKVFRVKDDPDVVLRSQLHQDWPQDVVLHHINGGGDAGINVLARLTVKDFLREGLRLRLRQIGQPYPAIHVRHTDMQSDYSAELARLKAHPPAVLFVASDNGRVVEHIRSTLDRTRVFSFARQLSQDGQSLHHNFNTHDMQIVKNVEAILDLLTMAHATELISCRSRFEAWEGLSGFSLLAKRLMAAPDIREQLVGVRLV